MTTSNCLELAAGDQLLKCIGARGLEQSIPNDVATDICDDQRLLDQADDQVEDFRFRNPCA